MVRDNPALPSHPRLLLAYTDSAHASRCVRYFRRLGWEVHMVASGAEAQRLAVEMAPHVVVVDAALPDESGWLIAARIRRAAPQQRVILLTETADAPARERADALGIAGPVERADGPEALAALVYDRPLSVAV